MWTNVNSIAQVRRRQRIAGLSGEGCSSRKDKQHEQAARCSHQDRSRSYGSPTRCASPPYSPTHSVPSRAASRSSAARAPKPSSQGT